MTEKTFKEKFIGWLGRLWGQDEVMMERMPSKNLSFELKDSK